MHLIVMDEILLFLTDKFPSFCCQPLIIFNSPGSFSNLIQLLQLVVGCIIANKTCVMVLDCIKNILHFDSLNSI